MLHFCKIEDITSGVQVASRFVSQYDGVRALVTAKINRYIRRNLEYKAGVIEYFDTPNLQSGRSMNLWLEKKAIERLEVGYSQRRDWGNNILEEDRVMLDAEHGRLTVFGFFRGWNQGLRVTYDGGYRPMVSDATTMACPEGLRYAAAQQCIYDAKKQFGGDQGTSTDDDKKTPVKLAGDLLYDTAMAFLDYRRPLGR